MTRMLFVDDDEMLLESLEDALWSRRAKWDMVFVPSGRQALEECERTAFDVVVTDFRMPGMDGAALLSAIRERYPGMARIVLSGQTDENSNGRLVHLAHQLLAKPTRPEVLVEVLERTCSLRELLMDETLLGLVGAVGQVPIAPVILSRLEQLLDRPTTSVAEVAELIERDPGMSAKILQLVNSAFFGLPRAITELTAAVSYLGTSTLRGLVVSFSVMNGDLGADGDALMAEVQRSGVAVAAVARAICGRLSLGFGAEAFVAGLVHDVGRMVLAGLPGNRYDEVLRECAAGSSLCDAERRVLGATHAEVGGYLLGLWGLPLGVVEAVVHHHDPRAVASADITTADVVHLAKALVALCPGDAADSTPEASPVDREHLRERGLEDLLDTWWDTHDTTTGRGMAA
ncbi:MAG: HDOD domain-containing protein [Thermoleophilia bacterium]|mgnify:CR=1 FL=1